MFPVVRHEPRLTDVRKVLFLGNSITRHPPSEAIGWNGDWGMAASAPDKDYVHLVAATLAGRSGKPPEVLALNIAEFERNASAYNIESKLKDALAFDADLVILAIGENVPQFESRQSGEEFESAVLKLLSRLQSGRDRIVLVRGCFRPNQSTDDCLLKASRAVGVPFIEIGRLGGDADNAARSERPIKHEGVAGHPGDRGMRAIADAIIHVLDFRETGARR
jgi:hypothetical protein